jgi:hypothetical protein
MTSKFRLHRVYPVTQECETKFVQNLTQNVVINGRIPGKNSNVSKLANIFFI